MELNKEDYNNFQLVGTLTTFSKRLSKKDTIWGFGTIVAGSGRYRKWLNITAFGEEICNKLEEAEACVVMVNGVLANGFGDKKYSTNLIVEKIEVVEEAEETNELVSGMLEQVSESDLPF